MPSSPPRSPRFGDDAVAGWAIIGRIIPVAFGVIFALSGAVGPIIGQNFGARRYRPADATMRDSLTVTIVYVLAVWALLALFAGPIASLFGATGLARELIVFFCLFVASCFLFDGAIFVSSAAFNNLGYPAYSTRFQLGPLDARRHPVRVGRRRITSARKACSPAADSAPWSSASPRWWSASARSPASPAIRREAEEAVPALPPAANSPFSTGKASTLQ